MSPDIKLDRMAEIGFKEQTTGGVWRQVPVMRLHLAKPGEANMLCGKARSELKVPPAQDFKDLCRTCAAKARAEKIPY